MIAKYHDKEDIDEDVLHWITNWSNKKIKDGKSLIELTTYSNVAMWWFIESGLYTHIIDKVKELNKFKNKTIRNNSLYFLFKTNLGLYLEIFYDILTLLMCKWNVKLYKINPKKKLKYKILITAQDVEWKVIRDYTSNELRKSDAFFDSVIQSLKNKHKIVTSYPLGLSPISGLRIMVDKRKNQGDIIHKPFNIYWSWKIWKEEKNALKFFKTIWKDLEYNEIFKKLWNYNGIDLYDLIKEEMSFYFICIFPHMVKDIEMAKTMIKKEKPDWILLLNEYSRWERSLVIASKLYGVPTLAIQHGIITPKHPGYIYTKYEISPEGSVKSPYCPIPDITAVYGTYHKDLLTKVSAYPEDSVVVTGQPRYDVLYHADKAYSKDKFLKKNKINRNHKIVLWITQFVDISDEETIKNLKAVFETMQKIKNATLIIKQHPMEKDIYAKMIRKYTNNYKISAVITPKDSDTYEQLFICDLMITKNSTTAMEAIALSKPIIVLNLSKETDFVDYVEQGVALGVYKEEDLKPAIEKLLRDDTDLAKNRKSYVEKYLYKIDGKATERVVGLIEGIIKERRKK